MCVLNMYQNEYQWRMKIKKIQNDYLLMINDYDDTYYDCYEYKNKLFWIIEENIHAKTFFKYNDLQLNLPQLKKIRYE